MCKVVKPNQDLRLDLPAIGPKTVETCAACGGTGVEGNRSCRTCGGAGEIARTETCNVKVPAGVVKFASGDKTLIYFLDPDGVILELAEYK